MGAVVTVTVSGDSASVYALSADAVAEATSFWNLRFGVEATAFAAATADNKARLLVLASDWIDRAVGKVFSGTKTVSTQPREFPRDGATCNGTAIDDGTTPDNVANATFWLAGKLAVDATIAFKAGEGSNVKQVVAGSAEVTFFTPTIGSSLDTRLPVPAMDYLKCLLSGAGRAGAAGVATGTSNSSAFADTDFTLNDGFS